jgi:hypothetical protein
MKNIKKDFEKFMEEISDQIIEFEVGHDNIFINACMECQSITKDNKPITYQYNGDSFYQK